jgi:hypothetical protein
MTTFVLILTLLYGSPAITSVPGFETDAACQAAGHVWKDAQKSTAIFVCVGQGKK